ncbi:DNA replication/repair protein RecF [Flavihumibacter sp. R14]|nr:DNA replication/repair protein RecF [Flavihumibacter soli]
MWLRKLSLINFKNYSEAELNFSAAVNAFTGNNGAGKTNLLDAIHYLSLCKSYFNPIDGQQIKHNHDFFMLQGVFNKDGQEDVVSCGLKRGQKKQFKRNKKEYLRLADHIGLFPLVMISPNDISIIIEGSEERRRFIDNVISQTDHQYLDELITYNRNLQNRNALLRQIAVSGKYDPALLEIFDEQLILSGNRIFEKRRAFMNVFTEIFNKHYHYISDGAESVGLLYDSPLLRADFSEALKQNLERDRVMERTTVGIHKDDLVFSLGEMPLKKFGSQGQQKSFLIALKLSQYTFLQQRKGFKPLLLLDDIFDKLDENRTRKLMKMVSDEDFGQIFITDTSRSRIEKIFSEIDFPVSIFDIHKGEVGSETVHR